MFYAHSTAADDHADWQTLVDHAEAVARLAGQRGARFGGAQCAEVLGWLHDLGKYSQAFQRRLAGSGQAVDHATAGAIEARERYGPQLGMLMAYALAGHHAGLANGRSPGARRMLSDRLQADIEPLDKAWQNEITVPALTDIQPPPIRQVAARRDFQSAFVGRMLFSCLVDADFIETESFYAETERRHVARGARPDIAVLQEALDAYLKNLTGDGPVNGRRREILSHVRAGADQAPGHFSLTVPTGGGKTLTSLAFALDHAIAHGMDRVIYVIPFTSIVEQNAAVFRGALGAYGYDAVVEHHGSFEPSATTDFAEASNATIEKLRRDSENWDAPIIVTTAVQFFESLFAAKTSRCRKLHNIANSVVILDEAQTLPLGLLRPSLAALDELRLNYGTSLVYCTATQPALADDHLGELPEALADVRELAPEPDRLFRDFERVRVRHIGAQDDSTIVEMLTARKQVLCIVNNRRHARYLFDQIADQPGVFHLTTAMYAHHRREVLATIRQCLEDDRPCRVVATSLIEAGVDVDFPCVLRAEAGLDAIAQAAGRCNREGRCAVEASNVFVFSPTSDDWAPPPELRVFAQVMREVLRNQPDAEDVLSPRIMQRYFEMLYWHQGRDVLDTHQIMALFDNAGFDGLPFEEAEKRYRLIENTQCPVIIPADKTASEAIQALAYTERVGGIARTLQQYSVQVPRQGFAALEKKGAIYIAEQAKFGDAFVVLANTELYDRRSGLNWSDPTFMSAEGLVM